MAQTISSTLGDPETAMNYGLPQKTEEDEAKIKEILAQTKNLITGLKKVEPFSQPENQIARFEVLFAWQWRLEIEGLDHFLVKKVEFPKYVRQEGEDLHSILKKKKRLTIYLYEALAPATYQQVEEMLLETTTAPRKGCLRYLNSRGEPVRSHLYSGIRVEEVQYDALDYGSRKPLEIKLVISYEADRLV